VILVCRGVGEGSAFELYQGEDIHQFVGAAAETVFLGKLGGLVRILEWTVQLPEGVTFPEMDFHRQRDILFDQLGLTDRVEHGLFHGDNVIRAEDTDIRQDGHAGKTEAVTNGGHFAWPG